MFLLKGTNYWRNRIMKAALAFKDTKAMSYAIAKGEDFAQVLQTFGLTPKDDPVATIRNEVGDKFVMTAKKFRYFISIFLDTIFSVARYRGVQQCTFITDNVVVIHYSYLV
jgi:hypothetical protein